MEEKVKKVLVPVTVIKQMGATLLVQWMEGKRRKRGYIPSEELIKDKVDKEVLEMVQPYGIPFADIVEMKATPQRLEDKLYDSDIWTLDDLMKHSKLIPGIIQSVYSVDMAALFTAARNYEN